MYEPQLRLEISQGDIFDAVPIPYVSQHPETGTFVTEVRLVRAMMLTHDCEFDKPQNGWVIMAEVRPLAEIAQGSHGHIRAYKAFNTFYLAEHHASITESYVNFRSIDRLNKSMLGQMPKIASLTDKARLSLQL